MGKLLLVDPPEVIRKKVMSAVTDTGREVRRGPDKPGVSNLIDIMSVASGEAPEAIENRYGDAGYGRFKSEVADAVIELLTPIRDRFQELRADGVELERLLAAGAARARETSEPTLRAMYERMGFARPTPIPLQPASGAPGRL
jgi:tryptophanyl-tRNA synthetase